MVEEVKKKIESYTAAHIHRTIAHLEKKKSHRNGRKTLTYLRRKQASEQSDENLLCVFSCRCRENDDGMHSKTSIVSHFRNEIVHEIGLWNVVCLCVYGDNFCYVSDSEKYNQHLLKKKKKLSE